MRSGRWISTVVLIFATIMILDAWVHAQTPVGRPPANPREGRQQPQTRPGEERTIEPLPSVSKFTDEDIDKLKQKYVDFLLSKQLPEGNWPPAKSPGANPDVWLTGPTAIAIYALIESGISAKDPRIVKALDWLIKNYETDYKTYSAGFRCNAWLAANKQTKKQYQKQLEQDVNLLVESGKHFGGGGRYDCYQEKTSPARPPGAKPEAGSAGDNSNSQYVLLGVWAGARGGMEISKEFWEICQKFWITRQMSDGGWNYGGKDDPIASYGAMSTAGLASLFVCLDATGGDKFIKCDIDNEYAPVKKGLDWFEKNFEKTLTAPWNSKDNSGFGYYLYGVERVGLASGYKYFGKSDWYKEGCKRLLAETREPGSISPEHEAIAVAYYSYQLLFISRGQRPVLLNKLQYDGAWNNRPRALANFCRWAENAYEHEVNWQIVTLKSEVGEWHDAPVVLITGSKAPKFSEDELAKLRTYVNQGGTLLSITECSGAPFGGGMRTIYKKLFPRYELKSISKEGPLYSSHYKLPGTPAISIISNGIRPLAIHIDSDLPLSWQTYAVATAKANFEAAANILTYVTDRELYNRGVKVWPDAATAVNKIKAARIRYAGNYDPEPLALERLSRLMAQTYKIQIDCVSETAASAPASQGATPPASIGPITGILTTQLTGDIRLAFLTGTGGFKLPDDEKEALKKWVDAGGLLIVDAAGGSKPLTDSAKELVAELWGADTLLSMPLASPIYQLKDLTIDKVKYRKTTRARIGGMTEPRLMAVLAGDRPKVILSAEDLTAGMVGYSSWGLDGYDAVSAFNIVRNIIIYAAMGKTAASPAVEPSSPSSAPAQNTSPPQPAPTTAPAGNAIDWQRAMELYRKEQKGEALTPDEKAYLERAKKAKAANPGGNDAAKPPPARE
ncbi:MAG: DUF4159 domain-containing protein [Planctomycetes bacterium]|nr:DUF4159 domain-containing protein [Planctomycetota bacterium]